MTARQLDLFSGVEISTSTMTRCETEKSVPMCWSYDPCRFCEFKDLCPPDECGQLLFPIDGDTEDFMSEQEYMRLLHRQGLHNNSDFEL